jgi:hypothetical protein
MIGPKARDAEIHEWTTEFRGPRNLVHRLVFTFADFGMWLWGFWLAILPATLLLTAVAVGQSALGDATVGVGDGTVGGLAVYCYTMYVAVMILSVLQTSERFTNTSVEFDSERGKIVAEHRPGKPSLFGSEHEVTASFDEVESARFLSLAGQTLLLLSYKKLFASGTAFLVPSEKERVVRDSLRRHDVSIREAEASASTGWVWRRLAVTVLLLGVIPTIGIFVWPVHLSWAVILVLGVNSVLLSIQG